MTYSTLVSTETLHQQLNHPDWIIIDCRFSLADTEVGAKAYRHGHIPNAHYAHLDKDLSSAITDFTGRHPLPNFALLAKKLGDWGVTNTSQVVVYDDAGGAFADRLWWLLRCMGHDKVAVLNGGIKQWQKQGLPVTTTLPTVKPATFRPSLNDVAWLSALQVQNNMAKKSICLIDARTPERYRGEQEPIDPVAGHIPGALNRAFQLNLDSNGLFLSAEQLREQFNQLIGATAPEQVVHYCGSGVTACHNLLAMEYAGLTGSKLYAGSWSEWIRNKNRAVAKD
ncbi:sulfurtransferase [Methylobacter tundripaludum]|uniref:3-mercaptopyruvate sulfurtransferase n=1 Tax=Methylobacter tundripaludum (strain ATCC BAA-1195 / DSM 17260 / SV96) TaxID=697282 RepID=G3IZR2_METTV|nr:sulfurtransferase [Methylobacter tundripaludum]EGW20434.1 3-mercaptopyruvate sulfurtransferase [Methylobacter tundripaludum SV96]